MATNAEKLLIIARLFLERTDEKHAITVNQIISHLEANGIMAERRAIYRDIEVLQQSGMDIVKRKTKTHDYYLGSRNFEVAEVKLLIDIVQASPFITQKKSLSLIGKLTGLISCYEAANMRRQVYVYNRAKSDNERLYYNIDAIHTAIQEDRKIGFRYYDHTPSGDKAYRKDGRTYHTSPVALCVDNHYYLIAYYEYFQKYVHYRVDRMDSVEVLDSPRDALPPDFDLGTYSKRIFDMYDGQPVSVRMAFRNEAVNVVMDQFGTDIMTFPEADGWFSMTADVAVSPTFLSWVAGFGDNARIREPESVVNAFREYLEKALRPYT